MQRFYIDQSGNYYAGDKMHSDDIEVPERPSPLHKWNGTAWAQDEVAIKASISANAAALLESSDWSVLPDVNLTNKQAWIDYRAALRAIWLAPAVDSILPTKPEKVWA